MRGVGGGGGEVIFSARIGHASSPRPRLPIRQQLTAILFP